jgi:hypothetical protein
MLVQMGLALRKNVTYKCEIFMNTMLILYLNKIIDLYFYHMEEPIYYKS